MPIDPQEMKRLALIRFLYTEGLEEVARPAPLSSRALLSFHDAVEMFLLLAAEHLNVNLPRGVHGSPSVPADQYRGRAAISTGHGRLHRPR
jgi:hypothetical protein